MRCMLRAAACVVAAGLMAGSTVAQSGRATEDGQDDVSAGVEIARQGDAVVYEIDVDAHMATVPAADRSTMANSPKRIQQMLSFMLMRRNAALEARKLGLGNDPITQREIQLATEGILMRKRIEHLRSTAQVPDMTQFAQERFLAEPERFQSPELVSIVHVLLKTEKRSEAEAVAQVEEWRKQIAAGEAKIEDLAKKFSDDPGVGTNGGIYGKVKPEIFVPEFAAAIKGLEKPGDLSGPVKTQFGIHLIQLQQRFPAKALAFEEIREQLIAQERERYITEKQRSYLDSLKGLPVQANEDSVFALRTRYNNADTKDSPAPETPTAKTDTSGD